jgi:hypothetical protein
MILRKINKIKKKVGCSNLKEINALVDTLNTATWYPIQWRGSMFGNVSIE